MRGLGSKLLPIVVAAVAGGVGGYFFGFAGARSATRTTEAATDLLVPAQDFRNERVRRDAIRAELRRLAGIQVAFMADSGRVADDNIVLAGSEGFILHSLMRRRQRTALQGRKTEEGWIATLSHEESPAGERCAVALGVEPAYGGGIPLRRAGRIRCSWDLATRLNLLW